MAVRFLSAMSTGLSASMADVAALSDSAFCKRFRPSYESSPSSSPLDLPSWKRYPGTFELVEDAEEEGEDDEEEFEEMEESLDFNSMSKDVEDEGPIIEDEDPTAGDEGLAAGDEGPSIGVESLSLGGDEAVPEGQPQAAPVVETAAVLEDGIVYINVPSYPPPAPPAQTSPSPELSSGSHPISPAPSIVSSPISSPMILLTITSPVASPAMVETKGFLTELGALVKIQEGLIRDHMERVTVNFGAIWIPVLALEVWTGQADAERAAMWHVISDTRRENQELRLQLAEERHARFDLAEIIDSMRRGQDPEEMGRIYEVKENKVKNKIKTEPEKSRTNEKRRKARQSQRSVTMKKAAKRRKYKLKGPKLENSKVVLYSRNTQGLK
uniref:Uncharacterized protein n=1 Tax=Tanacetum cinerariifolium TaxID=118510 RepID=A0A699ID48_TANCI|nr:hypothetical protein [Tanacetum cinerariifolium]